MKVVMALILCITIFLESLFPKGLAMAESARLTQLFEHFKEHNAHLKQPLNFSEFLWLHYNPDADHEDASHHHEKLPQFQTGLVFMLGLVSAIANFNYDSITSAKYLLTKLPEYSNKYFYLFALDVLNPPQ